MTTGEIIDTVAHRYRRYFTNRDEARTVVLGVTNIIADALERGHNVRLENLGTLAVQETKQLKTLFGKPNPKAGQITRQVTFRDSASLKRLLND